MIRRKEVVNRALRDAARRLPPHVAGAPFRYRNPLQSFEDLDFGTAVAAASELYRAEPYLSERYYHEARKAGEYSYPEVEAALRDESRSAVIPGRLDCYTFRKLMLLHPPRTFDPETIQWVIEETDLLVRPRADAHPHFFDWGSLAGVTGGKPLRPLFEAILERIPEPDSNESAGWRPRDFVLAATGSDVDEIAVPFVVRQLRSFAGIGQPRAKMEGGLFEALHQSIVRPPESPWFNNFHSRLCDHRYGDAREATIRCLETLSVGEGDWPAFLCKELLVLKGWASLFAYLERPGNAFHLVDVSALSLMTSVSVLETLLPAPRSWRFLPAGAPGAELRRLAQAAEIFDAAQILGLTFTNIQSLRPADFDRLHEEIAIFHSEERRKLLHDAFERGVRERTASRLALSANPRSAGAARPAVHIVCCADDKLVPLRRSRELASADFRTHGMPSFLPPELCGPTVALDAAQKADALLALAGRLGIRLDAEALIVLAGHDQAGIGGSSWTAHCGVCDGTCDVDRAEQIASWGNDPQVRQAMQAQAMRAQGGNIHPAVKFRSATISSLDAVCGRSLSNSWARPLTRLRALMGWGAAPTGAAGHPGCNVCLIGFRADSIHTSAPGAFMASYEPAADPGGSILSTLFEDLIPSCAAVNLDYFFSRVDAGRFGLDLEHTTPSGDPIDDPQGDLQAGLPWTAVEHHPPVRLHVIVNAPSEIVRQALASADRTLALHDRKWVCISCWDREHRGAIPLQP